MGSIAAGGALHIFIYISQFKHICTVYKFNTSIVLQFGPVQIKAPNELCTNKLHKIYTSLFGILRIPPFCE